MRRFIVTSAFAALGTLAVLSVVGVEHTSAQTKGKAAKATPPPTYGNVESISQEELKNYLYFIASDQLEGRNFPSRGFDTAAIYVAGHLAEWGLKPGGSTSGTTGPLQSLLELIERRVLSKGRWDQKRRQSERQKMCRHPQPR